ncbi:unnamed protein product [Durusdinium trenchii]|uniref:Beta-lactamase-related domain-containing protein n=1 Tax=Durusdinium trenchii TaxID=1381693 RepID=A0ABP0T186_9DINO
MEKHIFSPASMDSMGFVLDKSLSKQCVSTDYHPWILPAVADGLPGSRWRRLRLRVMGMLGLLCGRKVVDHLKPAGSGVILPLKIWDRSLKFFHPDAGIVGTGADFVEWLKIMTNNGKGNDARQIFSQFVLDALATPTTPELQAQLSDLRRACVIVEPDKAGLPTRAKGAWHWMGFASTYFFVNPREELAACFLTQLVSHRTYPILDELVQGVHESLT